MIEWLREAVGLSGLITFIGALIVAFGAVMANVESSKKERELRARSDEIAELNRKVAQRTDDIAALNAKLAELTIGTGDVFANFILEDRESNGVTRPFALVSISNETGLPAYDVVLNDVDVLQTRELKRKFQESTAARLALDGMFQKTIGTVAKKQAVALTRDPLPLAVDGNEAVHELRITSRADVVSQVVRFVRVNGKWTFATRAVRQSDQKPLHQEISAGYPAKDLSADDWWSRPLR